MARSGEHDGSDRTPVGDWLVVPGMLALVVALTWGLEASGVPPLFISGLAVGPVALLAAVLERIRPARPACVPFDQPLAVDAAHFFLNYQLGYVLALAGCAAVGHFTRDAGLWPTAWPVFAQVVLASFLAEASSYWQHRAVHRVAWLWPFHALHHSGARLNLVRAGRFHFVDISVGAFMVFVPVVALGAPDMIVTWLGSLGGVLGVWQHANIRCRTPRWLDRLVCTPAVHRHHHSASRRESDANFGTVVMVFDVLLGTYEDPDVEGPETLGIENDPIPRGFWPQVVEPFAMAWRAAPSVPREAVVAAKDRWLAALALGALAFVSIHCGQHLEARHFDKLLWLSNAATALLAVGCMVRVPRLNAVALLWLSFSTLLWVFDVAHGAAIDSAVLTHVGSLVLAIVAVRLAPPTGSTWPLATFGLAVVVALSRWLGEPTHNVNLVFGFAPGWQATGVSHPAYVVALALAAVVLFVAVDAGAQRLITRNVRRDSLVA